ncbi:MAG: glycerate kinase [Candidatus Izemoplasmatales bacterium]
MKFIVATDSFKGSISSVELVAVISNRIKERFPDASIIKIPIADGGEGTIDSLITNNNGKKVYLEVTDPLFRKIQTYYGILNDGTAIIEIAKASGLTLLDKTERNPLNTTTYGVGEIIKDALDKGVKKFIVGIGGSATNDAGIGMLNSLGIKFFDKDKKPVPPVGKSLNNIEYIELDNFDIRLKKCQFLIACDVDNPLFGINGASYIYGPQKGANTEIVKTLDLGLNHFNSLVENKLNIYNSKVPGSGAAGGLGYAFLTFFNAELKPGIDIVLEKVNIESHAQDADFIITGEGKIDMQSAMGKVLSGIGRIGIKYHVPVIALAGNVDYSAKIMHEKGITSMFSIINKPMSFKEAINKKRTISLVENTMEEILWLINSIKKE